MACIFLAVDGRLDVMKFCINSPADDLYVLDLHRRCTILGYFQIIRWPGKLRTSVIDDLIELFEQMMVRAAWLLYELCVWYLLIVLSGPKGGGSVPDSLKGS